MIIAKTYVLRWLNWLFQFNVNFKATPNPLIAITDTEPISEQIEMYTNGFERPYFGATAYIMTRVYISTEKT